MIIPEVITTHSSQLRTALQNREAKLGIVGLGYVGLPLTLSYVEQRISLLRALT